MENILSVKIAGEAGHGIKSIGLMLAKIATRSGFHVHNYVEYPSLIRGGHNTIQVTISKEFVTALYNKIDLLVALNLNAVAKHLTEVNEGGLIVYDSKLTLDVNLPKNITLIPIPLSELAKKEGGGDIFTNTVALGAVVALLSADLNMLNGLIEEEFKRKGDSVVLHNKKSAEQGYNYIQNNFKNNTLLKLKNQDKNRYYILNGSDAVALGAIRAGIKFACIYPMSPISGVLHTFSKYQEKYGYVYKQPEDEISAINMAIGASFAGARSLTATSGGGFCLMTEGYGLAGMTETPLVIVEGMRPGPATGLPTFNEQGDLLFVLNAHQGDFCKIVLAPSDPKEAYELTIKAFNLADKYQTPVVILLDKNICDNEQSYPKIEDFSPLIEKGKVELEVKEDYKRYKLEEKGISTRSYPGTGNFFIANSDEHNEYGYSSEEIENRNKQMEKRMQKLKTCQKEDMFAPQLYGPVDAKLTIVSWGSCKGSILEALKQFNNVNYMHITWISPFPTKALKDLLLKSKKLLAIENNFTGQLASLITQHTGIEIKNKFLKYDGRIFFADEIEEEIRKYLILN